MSVTNIDRSGTRRGLCTQASCTCSSYEYIALQGSACAFCTHAPILHFNIDDVQTPKLLETSAAASASRSSSLMSTPVSGHDLKMLLDAGEDNIRLSVRDDGTLERDKTTQDSETETDIVSPVTSTSPQTKSYTLRTSPQSLKRQYAFCIEESSAAYKQCAKRKLDMSPENHQDTCGSKRVVDSPPSFQEELTHDRCIPDIWPDDIATALRGGDLSNKHRCEIIRKVVDQMEQKRLSREYDIRIIADLMLKKMPALESKICPGSSSLVKQLKDCRKNKMNYARRRQGEAVQKNSPANQKDITELMKSEMAKANPSIKALKIYLTQCRTVRVVDSKKMSAVELTSKYPALKKPELLLFEFLEMVGINDSNTIRRRWLELLPKIAALVSASIEGLDEDMSTIEVLLRLSEYFSPKNRKSGAKGIITIHETGTLTTLVTPSKGEPPRLVAIGEKDVPNLPVTLFVDGEALYVGSAVESLLQLMSSFWVFSISFGENKSALTFISAIFLKEKAHAQVGVLRSVVKALEEIAKN